MTFTKRLVKLLEERGMTAAALSRKANVPRATISSWVAGVEPKNWSHIRAVSRVFGMTIEELLFGEPADTGHLRTGAVKVDSDGVVTVELVFKPGSKT